MKDVNDMVENRKERVRETHYIIMGVEGPETGVLRLPCYHKAETACCLSESDPKTRE